MEFQKGLTNETKDLNSQADLLCGDSIINYKTVQSMGHEELFVRKYLEYQNPITEISRCKHIKAGLAFGVGQFSVYAVFAGLFYFGGLLIENSFDPNKIDPKTGQGTYSLDPEDVFIAIFAIFFGASQAGTAMSMGPDIGKARVAATNVFKIIEQPSKVNAVAQDSDSAYISADNIQGIIEFKDVWFRYPSRKEDFVLRGLNIKINPNESIALVGESGCGKSTMVNLLMRFYDVDFGDIFIDGRNIKEYNLHSLRKKISLVMQEPNIFNYSIMENVLYGNLTAKNSDIIEACQLANCTEFIEKNQYKGTVNEPRELKKAMEENKDSFVALIGEEKYNEEMEVMNKLVEQSEKKGTFEAIEGAVDNRSDDLKDIELSKGFFT